ncbi:phasin family protein [uncultured Sphingomonas sp.]|uniref:phasin family protein n=1 Tax=uncultured Sphingomonas sp. TaxID=158754 RepID=UPI0035CA1E0A
MDLPTKIVEAVSTSKSDARPLRATRSAQRRRVAKAADAGAMPAAEQPAVPHSELLGSAPTPPVSFDPPATVMAEPPIEDETMDTIDTTANDAAEQMTGRGQAVFADMNGRAKDAMEKTTRMAEELGSFGKGNLEAIVESSKIAAKGIETLGQGAAEFSRKQFESATAAMKTLAATRSPTEFMKLQSDYARSMFDTMVAETSKSTELLMKLANDVAQPLSNRAAIAADKMKVAA